MPDPAPPPVCNTSPIQYLHQLGELELLRRLYGTVLVPQAVAAEIAAGRQRGVDLPFLDGLAWISVRVPTMTAFLPAVADLGQGEREVLALATETPGTLAILDDGLGRRHASLVGVRFTGTLGILIKAKQGGMVPAVLLLLDRLVELGFRMDPTLRAEVIRLAGE